MIHNFCCRFLFENGCRIFLAGGNYYHFLSKTRFMPCINVCLTSSQFFEPLSKVVLLGSSASRQVQPAVVVSRVSPPLLDKRLRVWPRSNQLPTWPNNLNLVDSLVVGTGKNWKVGEGACKVNLGKFLKVSQWQVLAVSIPTADQLRQTLICSAWGAGPICLKGF